MNQYTGHCCMCSGSCLHTGGPYFCSQHGGQSQWQIQQNPYSNPSSVPDYITRIEQKLDKILEKLK